MVDTNGDSSSPVVHLYNPDGTLNRVASDGTTVEFDCYSTSYYCRLTQTGTYRLIVSDSGSDNTGNYEISFNLGICDPTVPLTGYVTDATAGNAPLAGVTVNVGGLSDQTDSTGFYEIAGLSCATHTVSVTYPGYVPYARTLDRFARSQLNIALTTESTVNGITPYTAIHGDPVNTATGNYVYQRRDLELPGIGMALRLDRSYNSREASKAGAAGLPLGYGWTHSYQVSLALDAGVVTHHLGRRPHRDLHPRRTGRLHAPVRRLRHPHRQRRRHLHAHQARPQPPTPSTPAGG